MGLLGELLLFLWRDHSVKKLAFILDILHSLSTVPNNQQWMKMESVEAVIEATQKQIPELSIDKTSLFRKYLKDILD